MFSNNSLRMTSDKNGMNLVYAATAPLTCNAGRDRRLVVRADETHWARGNRTLRKIADLRLPRSSLSPDPPADVSEVRFLAEG
ncbi:hypothetical protein [Streptomyces mirabilis]|uniref:hypothetical protein n=1 Tax=Streptomyces mirabilis TaxID=68239 RepID=UPI00380FFFDD